MVFLIKINVPNNLPLDKNLKCILNLFGPFQLFWKDQFFLTTFYDLFFTLRIFISTSPLNTIDVLIVKMFNLIFGITSINITDDMVFNHPHVRLSINVIFIAIK